VPRNDSGEDRAVAEQFGNPEAHAMRPDHRNVLVAAVA
jgi:hypothetical protein